ncbi:hypothetical protein [Salinibacillus xinjiangensis]|uniref:GerAB/ArcD/ProY family transporter n=1 Tax=Salinibacillus xinjiangensis TaxID=1229268 RepID=A0A6G1XA37_9BACI|nr:hypothetical protein [Salinibacillus xinjiangensis]MRG87881.1 hypothetical protein [Salinibacillus xinjiangensis]
MNKQYSSIDSTNPVKIISRWLSVSALFTGPSFLIHYGLMEGIFFGVAVLIAVSLCYLYLTYFVDKRSIQVETDWVLQLYYIVSSLMQLFMIAIGGGMVISILFSNHLSVGIVIFIGVGFLFLYVQKLPPIRHQVKLIFLSLITTGLMVYTYVTNDAEVIFSGLRLYHPYLLYVEWGDLEIFTFAVCLVFMSRILVDSKSIAYILETKSNYKVVLLSGIAWASTPISFVIIVLSVIYEGGFDSTFTVVRDLLYTIDYRIVFWLVSIFLLFTLLDTFRMEFKKIEGFRFLHKGLVWLLPSFIFFLVSLDQQWMHFSFLFFIFGIWMVAFFPVIVIRFVNKKVNSLTGILAALFGYLSLTWVNFPIAILLTVGVAILLITGQLIYQNYFKK